MQQPSIDRPRLASFSSFLVTAALGLTAACGDSGDGDSTGDGAGDGTGAGTTTGGTTATGQTGTTGSSSMDTTGTGSCTLQLGQIGCEQDLCCAEGECDSNFCCVGLGSACRGFNDCCGSAGLNCEAGKCCANFGSTCSSDTDCCAPGGMQMVCTNGSCALM